jgi:uncharacterized membrane protein (DUF373 family)
MEWSRWMNIDQAIRQGETLVVGVLLLLLAGVLLPSIVELAWVLAKDVSSPPVLILEIDELLEIFGLFLLVLIGVELFEAFVNTHLHERVDRAEVVMIVAIIAISRKVIVIDFAKTDPLTAVGIGVGIVALALGYFLIKASARRGPGAAAGSGKAASVSDVSGRGFGTRGDP